MIPDIRRVRLADAGQAEGVAIVIDVFRAFSVAAYALAGGADRLWLVRDVEEALALRTRCPDALLAGEIGGRLIPGFDHNNSPSLMSTANVRGRTIIQRTGAGTQGAVGASHADMLYVCSLVNARATAAAARRRARAGLPITLLPTGREEWEEDGICADYIQALLERPAEAEGILAAGLRRLRAGNRLELFAGDSDFPAEDAGACLAVDRFDFAMPGVKRDLDGITFVEVTRADTSV